MKNHMRMSRRVFVRLGTVGAAATVAGCMPDEQAFQQATLGYRPVTQLGDLDAEPFKVPAVDMNRIPKQFHRQVVDIAGVYKPGTIVVDVQNKHLYYIVDKRTAIRYGVGVGKSGFAWGGEAKIGRKAKWPMWTPPPEMIERRPELKEYADGMEGGPRNPLGARAMYLYQGGRDTLFRLHGTNEPLSIGQAMSSGCIRMLNPDVIDLYERATVGTPVIVRQGGDVAV